MDTLALPPRQTRVRAYLDRLAAEPPQVLLMEGGTEAEREAMALYWAARLNCRDCLTTVCQETAGPEPAGACLACPACRQVFDRVHLDLIVLDGTGGETKEGTISIDEVREVRFKVGQPPHGDGHRVVIITKAMGLTETAANGLLKSLEEPRPGNVFVLLAPQRERLLPTLVSRSWILTLAWPEAGPEDEDLTGWLDSLEGFLRTGRGWFERTSAKGQVDRILASRVVTAAQRALAEAMAGRPGSGLASCLAQRPLPSLRRFDLLLSKGLEALDLQVSPAMVLDWIATQGRIK